MTKPYIPKGKALKFVNAAQDDPHRTWSPAEVALFLGQTTKKLGGTLVYALNARLIFKARIGRNVFYKGKPFGREADPIEPPAPKAPLSPEEVSRAWEASRDDPRCQRVVPGWMPLKMICVRLDHA